MRPRSWALLAAIALLAILLVSASGIGPLAGVARGRCVLGVQGAEATVTVVGWNAGAECETAAAFGQFYVEDLEPSGPVVCRYERGAHTWTVRDVGGQLVGSSICTNLSE